MGRYVFTPEIFDALERVKPGVGGEIQLTDAIALLLARPGRLRLHVRPRAATTSARRSTTCGPPSSWPSQRDDLGPEFRDVPAGPRRARRLVTAVIPLDEARAHVLAAASPRCPRVDGAARRGARAACWPRPVAAGEAVPPFDNTAMDGFAVRAADIGRGRRRPPGPPPRSSAPWPPAAAPDLEVGPGEAVRIMTGAPVPPGADAVVMVERTDAGRRRRRAGRRPRCPRATTSGGPATTSRPGDVVVAAGTVLTPGPPRRAGQRRPSAPSPCAARPGSACSPPATSWSTDDRPAGPGQIRDSNRPMLLALVAGSRLRGRRPRPGARRRGRARPRPSRDGAGRVRRPGHQRRGEHGRLRPREGGARPHRRHALDADRHPAGQAVRLRRWSTARRSSACPATRSRRWCPSSCFARPALRPMMGHAELDRPRVRARGRRRPAARRPTARSTSCGCVPLVRGRRRLPGRPASAARARTSSRAMAAANALAVLPDGDGVAAGRGVDVILLDE